MPPSQRRRIGSNNCRPSGMSPSSGGRCPTSQRIEMKRFLSLLVIALLPVMCRGQNVQTDSLSRAEQEAQQRSADYLSGVDVQRDILAYRAHYDDDGFWRALWQQGGANSMNWYQQLRLLRIHLEESKQRLTDSTNWIRTTGELFGSDLKPVTVTRQRVYLGYIYTGRIDSTTEQSGSLQGLLQQLQRDWFDRTRTTDPTGNYLRRDFDILRLSTPDASSYQLA